MRTSRICTNDKLEEGFLLFSAPQDPKVSTLPLHSLKNLRIFKLFKPKLSTVFKQKLMTKLMEGIEIMLDSEPFYWCDYKASGELV